MNVQGDITVHEQNKFLSVKNIHEQFMNTLMNVHKPS